jgi:hypothetical protein
MLSLKLVYLVNMHFLKFIPFYAFVIEYGEKYMLLR